MNALKTLKIGFSIITLLFFCVALSCDNDQSGADKQGNPGIEVPDGEFWAIDFEFDNSELVVLYSDYLIPGLEDSKKWAATGNSYIGFPLTASKAGFPLHIQ